MGISPPAMTEESAAETSIVSPAHARITSSRSRRLIAIHGLACGFHAGVAPSLHLISLLPRPVLVVSDRDEAVPMLQQPGPRMEIEVSCVGDIVSARLGPADEVVLPREELAPQVVHVVQIDSDRGMPTRGERRDEHVVRGVIGTGQA